MSDNDHVLEFQFKLDISNYIITRVYSCNKHLLLEIKYNDSSDMLYSSGVVLVYPQGYSVTDATNWRIIDPRMRIEGEPQGERPVKIAPPPIAVFKGDECGVLQAWYYAERNIYTYSAEMAQKNAEARERKQREAAQYKSPPPEPNPSDRHPYAGLWPEQPRTSLYDSTLEVTYKDNYKQGP